MGYVSTLIETNHANRDLKRAEIAIREGWNIPEVILEELGPKAWDILNDPDSTTRDKLAAARVLVAMKSSNDRLKVQRHQHIHAVIPAPQESELDVRRRELLARFDSFVKNR